MFASEAQAQAARYNLNKACGLLGYNSERDARDGCMCYGYHFEPDFGIIQYPKNPESAYKAISLLAKDDPASEITLLLVHCLINGIGVEKNEQLAFQEISKLVSRRMEFAIHVPAVAFCAYAYEKGIGVEKNEEKSAFGWTYFYDIISHDFGYAAIYTATRFYNGFCMPKDKERAFLILETIAAKPENFEDFDLNKIKNLDQLKVSESALNELINLYSGKYSQDDKDSEKLARVKERKELLEKLKADFDASKNKI